MGSLSIPIDSIFNEGINEVIVTTNKNAAPMGIIRKNDTLSMIVFRTSHTASNIIQRDLAIIHIVHDPILFVRTAFEDLKEDCYVCEKIEGEIFYRLKDIQNWIACKTQIKHTTKEKIFVDLHPVHIQIIPDYPRPVHRGMNNIIEATVHGTRFIMNKDPALEVLIRHHADLVMRCGGENDKKALHMLFSYVNAYVPHTFKE